MAESVLMCPKGGTNMTREFSRRSFLKYTALTAVAVAGSSLLTGWKKAVDAALCWAEMQKL